MFPEYRDLISRLKNDDAHFSRLFDEHNELDQRIKDVVNPPSAQSSASDGVVPLSPL